MICKKLSQIPKLLKNAIEPEIKKQEKEVNNNDISLDTKKNWTKTINILSMITGKDKIKI